MPASALKQPSETVTLTLPFPAGHLLTGLVAIGAVARGLVADAAPLTVVGGFGGGLVSATIGGGTDGERYLVTARASASGAQILEAELEVAVVDGAWTMPDGGAPWLSIADFVKKFGLDEVVAMTDRAGDGRIDRDYLVEKLTDAQAIAESHVAGRYALPLELVPRVLQVAVADLAAARLYPRGAPEGVAGLARDAMRMLERVQSGALPLGVPTPPPAAASESPVLFFSGSRAHPDGLGDI